MVAIGEGPLTIVGAPWQRHGGSVGVRAAADRFLHLARIHGPEVVSAAVARADGGPEIDYEGDDVEGEDEGDDPFENGGAVPVFPAR